MITLTFFPPVSAGGKRRIVRLAGQDLAIDRRVAALAPFEVLDPRPISMPEMTEAGSEPPDRPSFAGLAWLAGRERRVECWYDQLGILVRVDGAARWRITTDGGAIVCVSRAEALPQAVQEETALGPALTLALALRGVFCLHASAVVGARGAIAFVGASGSGKSTLAAALGEHSTGRFRRLADDILPVAAEGSGWVALPRFPQLKVPPAEQPSLGLAEALPLVAVYALGDPTPADTGTVESRRLPPRAAFTTLVGQTVASRLFREGLLDRHFSFSTDMATRLPVRSLHYPWSEEIWKALSQRLEADLGG